MATKYKIVSGDNGPLCSMQQVGASSSRDIRCDPTTGNIQWVTKSEKVKITQQAAVATITAKAESSSLNDVKIELYVNGKLEATLAMTFYDISRIEAPLIATPSLRPNNDGLMRSVIARSSEMKCTAPSKRITQPFSSTLPIDTLDKFSIQDEQSSLSLLRGQFKQVLKIKPPANGLSQSLMWEVKQNPDDCSKGLPTLSSSSTPSILVEQNATGSFVIRAGLKGCTCGHLHGCALKLVLIEVKLVEDFSTGTEEHFPHGPSDRNGVCRDLTPKTVGVIPDVDVLTLKADLLILSGGANGRLFLSTEHPNPINAVWVNNSLNPKFLQATYDEHGTKSVTSMYVAKMAPPHVDDPEGMYTAPPASVKEPILDSLNNIVEPKGIGFPTIARWT